MKCLIILLLFSCALWGQIDTIHFFHGKGVDNIKLLKSSQADVKKYKNVKYTKEKGAAISCSAYFDSPPPEKRRTSPTHRNRWKEYHNDSLGLTFKFSTKWKSGERVPLFYKMRLQEISLTKLAIDKEGITIGKSNRKDVIKSYGQLPIDWKNENYIKYDNEGISFRFDDSGILSEIIIFRPPFILVNESW